DLHLARLDGHGAGDAGLGHQPRQLLGQVVATQGVLAGTHPRVVVRPVGPEVLVGVEDRRAHRPSEVKVSAGSVPPYAHCTFIRGSSSACTAATVAGSGGSCSQARARPSSSRDLALNSVTGSRGSLAPNCSARRGRDVP